MRLTYQRARKLHTLTVLSCLLLMFTQLSAEQTNREWTSNDGRKLNASVLEIDTGTKTIDLKRSDGLEFTIQWSNLSNQDNNWIQKHLEQKQQKLTSTSKTQATAQELPNKFVLKNVPMVTQKGNFCVPASATMIAGFHGLETDQDEVAKFSSAGSIGNQGTYPSDMLLAMQKLGFTGKQLFWKEPNFLKKALPTIRQSLTTTGPIYISFKAGVFGEMGHGCVIIGYNDRHEEMTFHNPWGNLFTKTYEEVAREGQGIVLIDPPKSAPVASEEFVKEMQLNTPLFNGNFLQLAKQLTRKGVAHELIWCSRRDARNDKKFAQDTARRDGRKILELAFERNPAVLIPYSPDGQTTAYYFVTRPPEGGANFLVREITESGWGEPELKNLGRLTREWTTQLQMPKIENPVWELPLIELQEIEP